MSKEEVMNLREKLRYEFHKVLDAFYEDHATEIEGSRDTTWEQVIDGALRDVLSDNEENIQDLEEISPEGDVDHDDED
jgi:hypothetical protein